MANCTQCGRKLPPFSFRKVCEWCVRHEAAKRGEESEDAIQPVMPAPWASTGSSPMMVTQALLALNVLVFVIMALQGIALNPPTQALIDRGANYAPYTLAGQPWRLVTALFLHGGFLHILFNMWCLWDLGALCESLYGHVTFALVYLISGVGSSLASVWWHPAIPSVGASGAVFGIVGALIASYYFGEFTMPRFAIRGHLRSLLIFVAYNMMFGQVFGHIDNAAHIGGLITGLVFGTVIARLAPESGGFRRAGVILLVALAVAGCGAWLYQSKSYLMHARRAADLMDENKTAEAIAELQAVTRQRPNYLPAHFELAHAYFDLKKFDLAEAELQRVLAANPKNEAARYELGMVYLNTQRIPVAKDLFEQMVKSDIKDGFAHFGLAMSLAAQQNYRDAVEEYTRAAQLEPSLESLYYRLGRAQLQMKNYDEAIAAFLKQQQILGNDYETESALSEAYRAKGMQSEADAALKRAGQLKGKQ
jgi:membrane associated rhomboid family serine protease/cytochrome c-type biogenesis protein CcmH/NrfG